MYLGADVSLYRQQLVGPLFDDPQALQHVALGYSCRRSQHVVDGRAIAVDLVEQGIDTCRPECETNLVTEVVLLR